ncbi:MAG TPA: SepM family pheromone-processing serine protease [Bacillota bacterium]|nr:SepM family pheromone-processing serine protease [Bacillota bacterium]
MQISRRHLYILSIVIVISTLLSTFKMPYYIYKPGRADALDPMVEIDGSYNSVGDMHLVTVSGIQATPVQYAWAKVYPHHDVVPLEQVRPEGVSDEDYRHAQLQLMESSQQAAMVVAYEAAGANITIDYEGVFVVSVIDNMPAQGHLEIGDLIVSVDGQKMEASEDIINYVTTKDANETVELEIIREDEPLTKTLTLKPFADHPDKVGIGVQLVTDRKVSVDPEVRFSSGNIGGPSAGLMFSLKIYDLLTEDDLTKGYEIAGTGEVDYEGNVLRVGGVDKKVIAANKAGCDIFFVPFEGGAAHSNFELAKATAEKINASMEIVPVDTFTEAVEYLQQLPEKQN